MGDSLDLGRLADNLPSSNGRGARAMQAAEADLQSAFRNSALCITQMLKAGQKASKRSYQAGYSTALQDVLEYLQASLDVNVAQQRSNEGIAQVIDYIEARQEAVRLELQDIEADEEQQQQQQPAGSSSSQQHASTSAAASPQVHQSSQYFRSHPHRQQPHQQEQPQASISSYRQQYHPVASTSSAGSNAGLSNITNQQQLAQQQHHRKQRRSVSPLVSRTTASSANASMQALHNSRLSGSAASSSSSYSSHNANLPYQHQQQQQQQHRQVSEIEAERTQESIPLASSSSIPNSPEARFTPDHSHSHSHSQSASASSLLPHRGSSAPSQVQNVPGITPPHASATSTNAGMDLSLSSNASIVASPFTRLQAKRERERHHHHDRRRRNSHSHSHGHAQDTNSATGSAAVAAGVKRRWTAALLPEQHTINLSMNLSDTPSADFATSPQLPHGTVADGDEDESITSEDDEDSNGLNADQVRKSTVGSEFGIAPAMTATAAGIDDNDTGMEMDDTSYRIDGNARPSKRTARR